MEAGDLSRLPFLAANPNLLEKVIKSNLVVGGNRSAAIGGIGKRACQRVAGAVLCGVKVQVAVGEFDAAVGLASDVWIVRDH